MEELIKRELVTLESKHNIRILYACESGSRAWGFESSDSDYDVRFIYVRPLDRYLSLESARDVIETQPAELLDFAGWDIRKALILFRKSNPPLFEWLRSPVIYCDKFDLAERLRELTSEYFSPKTCLYHYLNMAEGNYRSYLQDDPVRVKKYFYVLRPLFACRWIEANNTMPPTEFSKLFAVIDDTKVLHEIRNLMSRKIDGLESDLEPKITVLNEFIEQQIGYYQNFIKNIEKKHSDMARLDQLFMMILNEVWK